MMIEPADRRLVLPPDPRAILAIGVIAFVLLVYTAMRAAVVSFSYDEAYTFMHHVRKGVFLQDRFDMMGANHHMLNVWAMWGSWKLFGDSEFALRLPNLLAHLLYLYGSARIALKASSVALSVALFLLLNMHPYLLDFFSLARGYGLSYGFLMMALWYTYRALQTDGTRTQVLWGLVFAAIGALAHSIMLNVMLGMTAAFVLRWSLEVRHVGFKARAMSIGAALLIVVLCLAVVLPNAIGLYQGGSLYFGTDGPWSGMMESLMMKFLYHYPYTTDILVIAGYLLATLGGWVLISLVVAWKWKGNTAPMFFALSLLAMVLLSLWVQNAWMGLPWPRSRTALFLVPLVAFLLVTASLAWQRVRWVPLVVTLLFCVPLVGHMFRNWNRTHVVEWKPSGEFRKMLEIIAEDRLPLSPERPLVTLSTGDECTGSFFYYTTARGWPWLMNSVRAVSEQFPQSDYYIVEYNGQSEVDRVNWTLLFHSEDTNTSLYRDERMRSTATKVIHHGVMDMEDPNLAGSFADSHMSGTRSLRFDAEVHRTDHLGWTVPVDWDGSPILVTGSVMTQEQNDSNWLTLKVELVRKGEVIEQRQIASYQQILRYGEWCPVSVVLRTSTPLLPGDEVRTLTGHYVPLPEIHVDDLELWVIAEPNSDRNTDRPLGTVHGGTPIFTTE